VSWVLRRGARGRLLTPAVIDVAIATLAVLLIASPLLFTSDGFNNDFTNAIWLAANQQHVISAHLHPTLFLHTRQIGVFDPLFAFYGGTLFALTGALAVALGGSAIAAFEIVTLAAIAAAYGGLFWLARQLGVKGTLAHAPAIVLVTSAYYVTNLYGRGAWAEFMAVSALPLVLAASLRLVRGRWRAGPVLCLVAATALFSGSHNITLLWGSTLALVALACCWLLSGLPRELPWRRMLVTAAVIALGVGLNGWLLLPDVSYAHDTILAGNFVLWSESGFFNTFGVVFDPLRTVPRKSTTPALYVQVPVLALAWGLVAAPIYWRERHLRAGLVTALIVLGALLALIMSSGAWSLLPTFFRQIQFAYRLQTYVTLACAGLVLLGALALTRRGESGRATRSDRGLVVALWLALAFGLALCAWQLWVPNTHTATSMSSRGQVLHGPRTLLPESWYGPDDYGDRSLPVIATTGRKFTFYPTAVEDDRLAGVVPLPPGLAPFATNIDGGPYLVHVAGGVRVVGRAELGGLVLKRSTDGSQPVPVELRAQLSAPVLLGRITTATAAALLLALALAAAVRRRRRHSAAPPSAPAH
jgi:MYXO-CTERM domain-containing protein